MFSGCITKSDYTVCAPEDLGKYEYAVVKSMTESSPAEEELEVQLNSVLTEAGMTIMEENRVSENVTPGQILLAEYDVQEGAMETIVNIAYSDLASNEEVAFCRGTWGLKGKTKNLALSENNAIKQTRYMFGLADEAEEFNEYSWY